MSTSHKQRIASDQDLLDALQSGDHKYLMQVLHGLTSISGEPLQWIAALLDGRTEYRQHCSKRLGFVSWSNQRPHRLAPKPNLPPALHEALISADDAELASALLTMSALDGEALDIVRRLFEPDYRLKRLFKKRLAFVGWSRGRPALDTSLRDAQDSMIRRMLIDCIGKMKVEAAVTEVATLMEVGKPRVWTIWNKLDSLSMKPKP
jgi:hypothetical protein